MKYLIPPCLLLCHFHSAWSFLFLFSTDMYGSQTQAFLSDRQGHGACNKVHQQKIPQHRLQGIEREYCTARDAQSCPCTCHARHTASSPGGLSSFQVWLFWKVLFQAQCLVRRMLSTNVNQVSFVARWHKFLLHTVYMHTVWGEVGKVVVVSIVCVCWQARLFNKVQALWVTFKLQYKGSQGEFTCMPWENK